MSKKKSGKSRTPQQRRRTRHLQSVPSGADAAGTSDSPGTEPPESSPESQDLFQGLRRALRSDHPFDLLGTVSAIVNLTDDRMRDPFADDEGPRTTLEDLVDSFVGVDYAETTAALTVLRALVPDDLLAARIGKVLKGRRQPMPLWLTDLDSARVARVVEMTHVLGDGDDYLLEVRLATGEMMTALVYVDHNMGGIVKDAFVVPDSVDVVKAVFEDKIDDPETSFAEVDPAVARAEVEEAVMRGAITIPRVETETWPSVRPLVEWILAMLPGGGEARQSREWAEEDRASLHEEFLASPYGRGFDGADERGLLEDFTWYGSGWGSGDPLRWSEVRVEILLTDWIPRKIVADVDYLSKAPALLRRFIGFCHDKVGLRRGLTDEVLAAVDRWEPEYQRLIRTDRPQGAEALARMLLDAEHGDEMYDDDMSVAEIMLESLDRAVGSRDVLLHLDTSPLPDEAFEWAGIPDDVHQRVQEVLDLCDRCADALFDVEHRTAFRRFLGRAAAAAPGIFRRKSAANRAAAAVCWAVAKANHSVAHGALESQELTAWFGVSGSVAQRAEVFLRANGVDPHSQYVGLDLGTPDLLTSARRRDIVDLRERYLSWED